MSKTVNIKNNIQDPILAAIKRKPRDFQIIIKKTDNVYSGIITTPFFDKLPPESNEIYNKTINYTNFITDLHFETKLELPKALETTLQNNYNAIINFKYNFLIKKFEDFVNDNNISEINLPDFYKTVYDELVLTPLTAFDGYKFFETDLNRLKATTVNEKLKIFSSKVDFPGANGVIKKQLTEYLETYNSFKEQFPYYSEIIFDNIIVKPAEKTFIKLFDKYDLNYPIMKNFHNFKTKLPFTAIYSSLTNLSPAQSISINTYDLEDLLNFYSGQKSEDYIPDFLQFLEKNEINYEKILMNEKNYFEIVGYKISIYDNDSNTPIKEIYLPNNTDKAKTELIETQIIYGKRYKYKISLLAAVVSANYSYKFFDSKKVEFTLEPKIILYEIDSVSYSNFLFDSPPIEPEVEIIPYIGIDNLLKINLNTAIGKKTLKPIFFNNEEKQMAEKIAESQDVIGNLQQMELTFNSEEPSDYFEMYRLENPPKNYFDFLAGQKTIIDNNNSSAGSIDDKILPNRKYYYTFRSIDYHKHVSNPTIIYQVEIVSDKGVIYPIIKMFEPQDFSLKETSRQFKRYLSVVPSFGNTLIDLEKNNNFMGATNSKDVLKNALIGMNNTTVWNKKFKIRLTSISTGKKIDLNLIFNINKNNQ